MKIEINDRIYAKFATLNKSETLDQYKEECSKPEKESYQVEDEGGYKWSESMTTWSFDLCQVEQYFKVTAKEWESITNSFLDDNIIYRGKGGTIYTGNNPDFDENMLGKDEAMLKDYRLNNARLITVIENDTTGELIAIDPQGYQYARYVGIELKEEA